MSSFISALVALDAPTGIAPAWIDEVPAFKVLQHQRLLEFRHPITVITGENGVGKSTLLEAIAVSMGFNDYGGPFGDQIGSRKNPLKHVAVARKGHRAMDGYFLRAESHFNVATQYGNNGPGVSNLHKMSHGESVMHVIGEAFHGNGLYLLDEPESGLSMIRQMTILAELHAAAQAGAQIIIVTHSPVLLAIPDAEIWDFSTDAELSRGLHIEETTAFRALRDFLDDPYEIAEYMTEVTDPRRY